MRILFITRRYKGAFSGGGAITKRNLECLRGLDPEPIVDVLEIAKLPFGADTWFSKFTNHLKGNIGGLTDDIIARIYLQAKDYNIIFFDGSIYGKLVLDIKKRHPQIKILTFFHNVESKFNVKHGIARIVNSFLTFQRQQQELLAIRHSDAVLALTARDANDIKNLCDNDKIYIFPSSIKDSFKAATEKKEAKNENSPLEILFVGSKFRPNIKGVLWFVEQVLPHVDVHLTIVGSGMDELPIKPSQKISIYGFVESLSPYYQQADSVVIPLFEGGGMKTKTTEALMWGKYIIGTDEAFVGFDALHNNYSRCNTKEEFISCIENLNRKRPKCFNEDLRQVFLSNYSYGHSISLLQEIISDIQFNS